MNDEAFLRTLKNGVMIAGHEMGPVGDHWPAIHAINKGLEDEFFQMQTDDAVLGELEFYLADGLRKMEEFAQTCPAADRKIIMEFAKQKWEEFYAIFEPIDEKCKQKPDDILADDPAEFKHSKAALQIVKNMGGRA